MPLESVGHPSLRSLNPTSVCTSTALGWRTAANKLCFSHTRSSCLFFSVCGCLLQQACTICSSKRCRKNRRAGKKEDSWLLLHQSSGNDMPLFNWPVSCLLCFNLLLLSYQTCFSGNLFLWLVVVRVRISLPICHTSSRTRCSHTTAICVWADIRSDVFSVKKTHWYSL